MSRYKLTQRAFEHVLDVLEQRGCCFKCDGDSMENGRHAMAHSVYFKTPFHVVDKDKDKTLMQAVFIEHDTWGVDVTDAPCPDLPTLGNLAKPDAALYEAIDSMDLLEMLQ